MKRDEVFKWLKADFIKDIDYRTFAEISAAKAHNKQGGQNKEIIRLSVDCFKQFGMMVSGERGKQIRRSNTRNGESVRKSHLKEKLEAIFDKDVGYQDVIAEISAATVSGNRLIRENILR